MQNSGSFIMEEQCELILLWTVVLTVKSRRYIGSWSENRGGVVALSLCMHNIPGSIPGPEAGYTDMILVVYLGPAPKRLEYCVNISMFLALATAKMFQRTTVSRKLFLLLSSGICWALWSNGNIFTNKLETLYKETAMPF